MSLHLSKCHIVEYHIPRLNQYVFLLLRAAGIPCVIINGYAKSAGYDVGDIEDDVIQLNNSWTCVFVENGWRFIFPLWACRAVVGHSTGAYTKVETKGI